MSGSIDDQVIAYHNKARSQPDEIIAYIEKVMSTIQGNEYLLPGDTVRIVSSEIGAWSEALQFMKKVKSSGKKFPAFKKSDGLTKAAQVHTKDIGGSG